VNRYCAVAFTALFFCVQGNAQVPLAFQEGSIFTSSYHGADVDKVNLTNGALSLRIPIYSLPEKGDLKLSYSLVFNSNNLRPQLACYTDDSNPFDPQTTCAQYTVFGDSIGPRLVIDQTLKLDEIVIQPDTPACTTLGCFPPDVDSAPVFFLKESDGTTHQLTPNSGSHNILYASDNSGYVLYTGGASGFWGSSDSTGCPTGEYHFTNSTYAITSDAIKHDWSTTTPCTTQADVSNQRSGILSDRSGNQITIQYDGMFGGIEPPVEVGVVDDHIHPPIPAFPTAWQGNAAGCPNLGIANQPATDAAVWTVPGPNGGNVSYLFCYTEGGFNSNEFADAGSVRFWGVHGVFGALQSVVLPNGTYWGFVYATDGYPLPSGTDYTTLPTMYPDLIKLIYPTGGSTSYTYTGASACGDSIDDQRRVIMRQQSGTSNAWIYTYDNSASVTVTDPLGNDTEHDFTAPPNNGACTVALETAVKHYEGHKATGQLLETETKQYQPQGFFTSLGEDFANLMPTSETRQLAGGSTLTSNLSYPVLTNPAMVHCGPNSNLNFFDGGCTEQGTFPLQFFEPDRKVTADPAGLTFTEFADYEWEHPSNTSNALATNDLALLTSKCLMAGDVASCGSVPAAAAYSKYGYDANGHQLSQDDWNNRTNAWVTTSHTYTATGRVHEAIDPNQNTTTFAYDANELLPNSITKPSTGGVGHVTYLQYDANTANLLAQVDENGNGITDTAHRTDFSYDAVGRLTDIKGPPLGGQRPETQFCYSDEGGNSAWNNAGVCASSSAPYSMFKVVKSSPDPDQLSQVTVDGFGRATHSLDAAGASVDTTYEDLGRIFSVTNPYFSTSDATYGFTTYAYDALGRKKRQCQPDNGTGSGPCTAGNAYLQWDYSGDTITFSDEVRNARVLANNALGRLVSVTEPSTAQTLYGYDVLGNLTSVNQHGLPGETPRVRSVTYDSLSRLISAFNPESGAICYGTTSDGQPPNSDGSNCTSGYDGDGNLVHKTSANGVTTNYTYDSLNRVVAKGYSGESGSTHTPSSCYKYDADANSSTGANAAGRLVSEWTQSSSCDPNAAGVPMSTALSWRNALAYDAAGRLLTEQQCAVGPCASADIHKIDMRYDLVGNLTYHSNGISSQSSPQIGFTQDYDSAGRLRSIVSTWDDDTTYHPRVLFKATDYAVYGLHTANLGIPSTTQVPVLDETLTYDNRARIRTISATASQSSVPTSTTTTVAVSPAAAIVGSVFTLSVHVDCNASCGAVEILIDGSDFGPQTLDGNGNISLSSSALPPSSPALAVGLHTVTANYLGDSTHSTSSKSANYTVSSPNTFVTLSMTRYSFTAGENSVIHIHAACGSACSGYDIMNLTVDGISSFQFPLYGNGDRDFNSYEIAWGDFNTSGTHTLAAHFWGDSTYAAADSSGVQFTMQPTGLQQVKPTLTLSKEAFTSSENSLITIHHSCNTACGQAYLTVDGNFWSMLPLDSSGNATLDTFWWWSPYLAVGDHTLVAHYLGDVTYAAMDSDPVSFTIQNVGTQTMTVSLSMTPQTFGQNDDTVAYVHLGCNSKCGLAIITVDGNQWGMWGAGSDIDANGNFWVDKFGYGAGPWFTPGTHTMQAVFLGNSTYAESYSDPVTITVTP